MKLFDSIIVGGGPAGLSAAIYLSRFNRHCLVIDSGAGRSTTHEINENYLGFPEGIHIEKLRKRGREQAEKFGAKLIQDKVIKIKNNGKYFLLQSSLNRYYAKKIILATGVTDLWPEFEDYEDYLGRSLFWCIACDGRKATNKRVIIVGSTDDAACTACQFLDFTDKIVVVTNQETKQNKIRSVWKGRLHQTHIPIIEGRIIRVHGKNGYFDNIELNNGTKIEFDMMFNQQGSTPNTELAEELKIKLNKQGYIIVDREMRTSVPNIYAVGDITTGHSHQVIIAAAEGAIAGEAINYDLYRPEQKWI